MASEFMSDWNKWYVEDIVPYLNTAIVGIFYVKNLKENKVFIGQSTNIYKRFKAIYDGLTEDKANKISIDMRRLGPDNFSFRIINVCEEKNLNTRMEHWIKVFNCELPRGYNRKFAAYDRGLENVKEGAAFLATSALILRYEFWYYLIQELREAKFSYTNQSFEYARPKISATDMAKKSGISRQTISGYLKELPETILIDRSENNGYVIIEAARLDEILEHCKDLKTIKEKNNYCRLVLYMLARISFFGGRYSTSLEDLQRDLERARAATHNALDFALEKGILVRTTVGNSITGRSSTYIAKK